MQVVVVVVCFEVELGEVDVVLDRHLVGEVWVVADEVVDVEFDQFVHLDWVVNCVWDDFQVGAV